MTIKDHGTWSLYTKPAPPPPLPPCSPDDKEELERRSKLPPNIVEHVVPANAAHARRADGKDWYDYLDEAPFGRGGVVLMIDGDIVVGTARDGSRIFPDNVTIIEITGYRGDDPDADFLNTRYDARRQTFEDVPLNRRAVVTLDDLRKLVCDLIARVEALEKSG
jgi:hypothetical protein